MADKRSCKTCAHRIGYTRRYWWCVRLSYPCDGRQSPGTADAGCVHWHARQAPSFLGRVLRFFRGG